MIVRHAIAADKIAVIGLLKEYHREAGIPFPFQAAYAERHFLTHALRDDACCLVVGQPAFGILTAQTFDHPLGWGKWADEKIWFVSRDKRGGNAGAMLDAYEAWAREQGCAVAGLATRTANNVSRIYTGRGYSAAETHFMRVL